MPIDPATQAFLDKANLNPPPRPGTLPLDEYRAAITALAPLGWDREEVGSVADLEVPRAGSSSVAVRLYRPENESGALVVCVHGGSWVRLSVDQQDEFYRALANRSGCALAAVDYRLAPESKLPNAIEEAYAAARWLQAEADQLGFDRARLGLLGESTGGGVAAAVAAMARDTGAVDFASQVLLFPLLAVRFDSPSWIEFGTDYLISQAAVEWSVEQYAPGVDRRDPRLSPLFGERFDGLPPTVVITAEFDPLRDDGEQYADALIGAGVPVRKVRAAGLIHHAPMVPKAIPAAVDFMQRFAEEIATSVSDSSERV